MGLSRAGRLVHAERGRTGLYPEPNRRTGRPTPVRVRGLLAACAPRVPWSPDRRWQMADDTPSIRLVRRYIEAVQRARASGDVDDFDALREFRAPTSSSRPRARGLSSRGRCCTGVLPPVGNLLQAGPEADVGRGWRKGSAPLMRTRASNFLCIHHPTRLCRQQPKQIWDAAGAIVAP